MCGIIGRIDPSRISEVTFGKMTTTLATRGPDGQAIKRLDGGRVLLGHRRLAIVDLSNAGNQPMCNETGDVWITFNGEIYNHPTLRRELERLGHVYRSDSDTESIIHAYEEWGDACVQRLRGIFAFAIWDERKKRLFAARDHVGVKPFYYAVCGDKLLFGSQPRALFGEDFRPKIAPQSLIDYLSHGIVPAERAAFEGMCKLRPAHTLTWQTGRIDVQPFWQVRYDPIITDFATAQQHIETALEDAVRSQLMSDVPIATYLSGGIDSSLLTAIATELSGERLHSFTVGFEERFSDERPYANVVVKRYDTIHHEQVLRYADVPPLLDAVVEAYDEPFGMNAALPMVLISQMTQACGFKVVLSGDGADELFAGYHHYDLLHGRYQRWGLRTASGVRNWPRFLGVRGVFGRFDPLQYYAPHEAMLSEATQRQLLTDDFIAQHAPVFRWRLDQYFDRTQPAVTAAQLLDLHTYLPDEILVKVDRATMAYGIEARVPFLDPQLVELAFSIDGALHYRNGKRKALLKAAARRWLPDSVLTERKKGFSIPLDQWIVRGGLQQNLLTTLTDGYLVQNNILRPDAPQQIKSGELLQLYLLERWARRWVG